MSRINLNIIEDELDKLTEKEKSSIVLAYDGNGEFRYAYNEDERARKSLKSAVMQSRKNEFKSFIHDECGSFYITNYMKTIDSDIDIKYLFRLLYLCTYMSYNNILVIGKSKLFMTKKDAYSILNMSEKECCRTIRYLEENEFIKVINNHIKINSKYCFRGNGKRDDLKDCVRMFDKSIRNIYENSTPREHKTISLLVKLLPWINVEHNIVCKNPLEENTRLLELFTLREMSLELGYKNSTELKKALFKIKVNGEKVIGMFVEDRNYKIVVNPRVYYKGSNIDNMKVLINIFNAGQDVFKKITYYKEEELIGLY